ncbi:hypothetical protein LA329_02600 [Corynebacterium falsenii]|uniref:hypothetical protein n=1 Tax=Corynebacterium falsenii TaxID=108486 RepID=UPI001CCFADBA|nr:hypothetical protein [Corynebacterium falsenii]UBI07213.1 hypothetical protein LA329_02600 [Corynebacterium falsenii]
MTSPAKGHLYPLVDTLIKLRSRGHSIVVKTLSSETQTLEDLGFTAIPLSDTLNDAQLDDWQATNSIGALNAVLRQLVSRMPALHVSECVVDRGVGFGVAQHIGVLAGTR